MKTIFLTEICEEVGFTVFQKLNFSKKPEWKWMGIQTIQDFEGTLHEGLFLSIYWRKERNVYIYITSFWKLALGTFTHLQK